MIPKIIHYCWFGGKELPKFALKCIESWRKYLPDYEIKEWNESNFNIDMYRYTREAYESGKFAFVSDVARLYALYTEGGIYMDTDVEVLKSFDGFLGNIAFSGFEMENLITTGILASEKGGTWVKENLDSYSGRCFVKNDGSLDLTTNVAAITELMMKKGLRRDNTYQNFEGLVAIYPKDYFSPLEHSLLTITENTVCIHHYEGSWIGGFHPIKRSIKKILGYRITNILLGIRDFFKKK
nr:glycosyltransferase [Phocaeicola sartorii]